VLEPTVPVVAPPRGAGYDAFFTGTERALAAFTRYWNWTGMPVVSMPAPVGRRTGLPVGVSLIGDLGADWHLLRLGMELQADLGVSSPPSCEARAASYGP
jgi:aspartyl-tRNA(Asn)/glutamyl-tRNA(Gln) amidotransferase subunit A